MFWWDPLNWMSRRQKLDTIASAIAVRKRLAVWQLVCERVGEMDVAEARGYIRARAARLICGEVDRALREHQHLATDARPRLIGMTTGLVIDDAVSVLREQRLRLGRSRQAA